MNEGPQISDPDLCIRLIFTPPQEMRIANLRRRLVLVLVDFCGMPILTSSSREINLSMRLLLSQISDKWVEGLQVWSPGQFLFFWWSGKILASDKSWPRLPITGSASRNNPPVLLLRGRLHGYPALPELFSFLYSGRDRRTLVQRSEYRGS